jgi:hypothetical protein
MTAVSDRRSEATWAAACLADPGLFPLFADWLEESGKDREGEAARWIGAQGRKPVYHLGDAVWKAGWMWWASCGGSKGAIGYLLWGKTRLATQAGRHDDSKWPIESYASAVDALLDLLTVWTPELPGRGITLGRPPVITRSATGDAGLRVATMTGRELAKKRGSDDVRRYKRSRAAGQDALRLRPPLERR